MVRPRFFVGTDGKSRLAQWLHAPEKVAGPGHPHDILGCTSRILGGTRSADVGRSGLAALARERRNFWQYRCAREAVQM